LLKAITDLYDYNAILYSKELHRKKELMAEGRRNPVFH